MHNTLKIIDGTFGHSILGYCCDYQTSDIFKWDRQTPIKDGDTVVITDIRLNAPIHNANNIAWLIEPLRFAPQNYSLIQNISDRYQMILTHEKDLLKLGEPYRFVPFGGCWIYPSDHMVYPKSKSLSIIASNKSITDGHKFRHTVINKFGDKMDVFGRGWNEIEYKLEGLKDYRYSIVIENCKRDYWFTEKLIDALVCGTVPIYWGCPSIGDFFDTRGFIIFDNINELGEILNGLTDEKYTEMLPYIESNLEKAKQYLLPDEWVYNTIKNNI